MVARVIHEAATDGTDQLRYTAGPDLAGIRDPFGLYRPGPGRPAIHQAPG